MPINIIWAKPGPEAEAAKRRYYRLAAEIADAMLARMTPEQLAELDARIAAAERQQERLVGTR